MKARVLSVYDEGSIPDTPLIGARGFSVLVDADGQRTLFGTGRRGSYLMHNLDYLEVDVNSVDRVVISHMHIDHVGGLETFLEKREKSIEVIIPPDGENVTKAKFLGIPLRRTGIPMMSEEARSMMMLRTAGERTKLSENLFLSGPSSKGTDPPVDENLMVLMTLNGPVLICGCCHRGLADAVEYVESETSRKISAILGGVHLTGMRKKEVHAIAEMLKDKGPPAMYLNHCSGQVQRTHLREKLGLNAVKDMYVGTEIQFDVR